MARWEIQTDWVWETETWRIFNIPDGDDGSLCMYIVQCTPNSQSRQIGFRWRRLDGFSIFQTETMDPSVCTPNSQSRLIDPVMAGGWIYLFKVALPLVDSLLAGFCMGSLDLLSLRCIQFEFRFDAAIQNWLLLEDNWLIATNQAVHWN